MTIGVFIGEIFNSSSIHTHIGRQITLHPPLGIPVTFNAWVQYQHKNKESQNETP